MKIIIDIPENDLDNFLNKCIVTRSFINSIADFITLDSVIDDVKTEIRDLSFDVTERSSGEQIELNYTANLLKILDNIGKKESEE